MATQEIKGSCSCGNCSYKLTGEAAMTCICHCKTCRKLSGSAYGTYLVYPENNLSPISSDAVKEFTVKHHETGMPMRVSFCGDCGVPLYKYADSELFKGTVIVFAGTLDDDDQAIGKAPQSEIWTKERLDWVGKVGSGAFAQFAEFP